MTKRETLLPVITSKTQIFSFIASTHAPTASGNHVGWWRSGSSETEAGTGAGRNSLSTLFTKRALTANSITIANTQVPPNTAHSAYRQKQLMQFEISFSDF